MRRKGNNLPPATVAGDDWVLWTGSVWRGGRPGPWVTISPGGAAGLSGELMKNLPKGGYVRPCYSASRRQLRLDVVTIQDPGRVRLAPQRGGAGGRVNLTAALKTWRLLPETIMLYDARWEGDQLWIDLASGREAYPNQRQRWAKPRRARRARIIRVECPECGAEVPGIQDGQAIRPSPHLDPDGDPCVGSERAANPVD